MTLALKPSTAPVTITGDGEIVGSRSWLVEQIGQGVHGSAHIGVVNGNRVCIKAYHLFLARNPAKSEFHRLQQARQDLPELRNNLQEPIGWLSDGTLGPLLVTALVTDYTGKPSRTLQDTPVVSQAFYDELERVLSTFCEKRILYNSVSSNILVQKISQNQSHPVLIDLANYKDYTHYPFRALSYVVSPQALERQVRLWMAKTLKQAKEKVVPSSGSPLESLCLPGRFGAREQGKIVV